MGIPAACGAGLREPSLIHHAAEHNLSAPVLVAMFAPLRPRPPQGREYGPDFIDRGLTIGRRLYEELTADTVQILLDK